MKRHDKLIDIFVAQCVHAGMPKPHLEYRFSEDRGFRFDIAWPELRIAVELSGSVHKVRLESDMEKRNLANWGAWRIFEYPTSKKNFLAICDPLVYSGWGPGESWAWEIFKGPAEVVGYWEQITRLLSQGDLNGPEKPSS